MRSTSRRTETQCALLFGHTWLPWEPRPPLLVHVASHWPPLWWPKSSVYSQRGSSADSCSAPRSPAAPRPCWCGFCSVPPSRKWALLCLISYSKKMTGIEICKSRGHSKRDFRHAMHIIWELQTFLWTGFFIFVWRDAETQLCTKVFDCNQRLRL